MSTPNGRLTQLRSSFHEKVCLKLLGYRKSDKTGPYLCVADSSSQNSRDIAEEVARTLGHPLCPKPPKPQSVGTVFGELVSAYLEEAFSYLEHIRPGEWTFSTKKTSIIKFEQYEHLDILERLAKKDPEVRAALDGDYLVKPDIVIYKSPIEEETLNSREELILKTEATSALTPHRKKNSNKPILHGSISCKWSLRSDRAQNSRTEALNLIRNRKGRVPHIVAVTFEPTPARISSIALGTGDIDCTYHVALPELQAAVRKLKLTDAEESLRIMVEGRRLRDISDLPLDLTT